MLTAYVAEAYDPATGTLSPEAVATSLHVTMSDLCQILDVHRNTLARMPNAPKVQSRLGDLVRILAEAADLLGGDRAKAKIWLRYQPIAAFGGQTAEELIAAGHAKAVIAHLAMLRDGGYA